MSDLKQAWEYKFINHSATGNGYEEVGPCLTYDKKQAFGVGCIKQREVFISTQPEATAPAQDLSAVTDAELFDLARAHFGVDLPFDAIKRFSAALASSANALSAGDRVDAALEEAAHLTETQIGDFTIGERQVLKGAAAAIRQLKSAAILQSQKGVQNEAS